MTPPRRPLYRHADLTRLLAPGSIAIIGISSHPNSCGARILTNPGRFRGSLSFEGVPDPKRFLDAADIAWGADKPLVVHKIATGALGAAAALTHAGRQASTKRTAPFSIAAASSASAIEAAARLLQPAATAVLRKSEAKAVLSGFRGSEPVDLERLAGIICRLSELAADQCKRIAEFDVDLLIHPASQIVAVDAHIVLARNG